MALQKINWTQIDSITVPSGYTVQIGKIDGPIDAIYSENIYLSGVSISDLYLNGGSFSQGVLTLTSNSGNTITVTGFEYDFDRYTTGFTYNDNNTFTIVDRSGYTLTASFNILTGLTINGDLKVNGNTNLSGGFTATTISASTYQNLPIDPDTYVTSFTYDGANKLTISDNNGTIFDTVINEVTGLTINGDLIVTGKTNLNDLSLNTLNSNVISATTISGDTFYGDGSNLENIVLSVNTGTGLSGNSTTGHITLINTDPDRIVTISGGTGILTGGTYPNFTITNTLPDQIVTLSGGTGLEITGTYPNFNINFTGQTNFPYLSNSGGTVTGDVIFQSGLTANTIYATTYENLPIDPDTYVTGFTYDNNKLLLSDNSGNTFNVVIDNFSGLTINGTLSATTISGGTFYGDGSNLTNIDNIYTVDGTLQSNRIIDLSGKTLSIKRSSNLNDPFLTFLDSSGKTMFEIRSQNINSNPNEDDRNIFIGKDSGALNTTGRLNVAFGDGALSGNTTGTSNTAIGWRAGRDHVDGLWNTFIGMNAGLTWVSGNDNTVVGQNNSHRRTSGTENTFIGNEINNGNYVAIITGGTGNTVLGAYSARLMGGDNNVIIGRRTGANLTTGSGNVFIGRNAGTPETTNSNLLYIENSTTSTPLIWGDFANDLLRFNAKVGVNVQPNTFQFDVNGTSRFSNTVQLDLVNSGLTDTKILTLSSGNVVQYRPLSDILSPVTADTYVTGFTYTNNTFKILDNSGSTFTATINEVTGLTINGDLTVTGNTNLNGLSLNILSANTISATTISGGTFYGVGSNKQVIYNNNGILDGDDDFVYDGTNVGIGTNSPTNLLHITGSTDPVRIQGLQPSTGNTVVIIDDDGVLKYGNIQKLTGDKWISGGSFDNRYNVLYLGYNTGGGFRIFLNLTGLTGNDRYVTGGTYNSSTGVITFVNNTGGTFTVSGFTDTYTTGATFDNNTKQVTFVRNDGTTGYTLDLSSISTFDTYVTGGTLTPGQILFTNNSGNTFAVTGFTKYFISGSSPTGYVLVNGDRWYNTHNGVEYVWVDDGDSSQWVQPATLIRIDKFITGGTLSGSTLVLTNNDGTSVQVTGITLGSSANIYNSDGTLTSNRTVSTTSGYTLTINPVTTFSPTNSTNLSGLTAGTLITPTLSASTSNVALVGLDISPRYNNGGNTNVSNIDLRTRNISVVFGSASGYTSFYGNSNDGLIQFSDAGSFRTRMMFRPAGNAGGFNGNWWSWIEQEGYKFRIYSGNYPTGQLSGEWLVGGPYDNTATSAGANFKNTGNVIIGSSTDSGHKLDSYGVTRIQNNFGVGIYSTPSQPTLSANPIGGSLTGQTTGTTYTYSIVGVDNLGYTTPGSTTRSISVSGLTNSVLVTWTAIPGISSYRVYRTNPWNGTTRFYSNILTNSFTDIGGVPASDNSSAPTANQTLKTNISSSGNLFVNSNGTFTGNVLIGGVSSGFEINTTSSTVPVTNVGIYRRPGNGNPTYFLEDEQGGAKDKWSFVRRGGYGLVREYYQGNSSIVNINLGWTNPNTNGWDANTLLIDPVINKTNVFSTTIRGIYYNPTLSGMTGVTHVAYQNTTGNNILNSLSGNTLIGTTTDVSSAILNVSSTTKGFLPPRMTGAQAELISGPAEGLMVYATDGSGVTITTKGWWGYDGSTWVKLN